MSNIFILGLQRSGTYYVETLLNNNVKDKCFRGHIADIKSNTWMTKHTFPSKTLNFPFPQDALLLVTKNPYLWVEGYVEGNELGEVMGLSGIDAIDIWSPDTLEKYDLVDKDTQKYNLEGLSHVFKDFYTMWRENEFCDLPITHIKYEDFLCEEKANNCITRLSYRLKGNLKLPSKPVRWSPNMTVDKFNYFKNETPTLLNKEQIQNITEIIGSDFIKKLGYSPICV